MHTGIYITQILLFRLVRFILFTIWACLLAHILKKISGKAPSKGITIFCVLLILGVVHKLIGFGDYAYYKIMFKDLPEHIILIRYIASIAWRILGFATAVGILLLKDVYRKVGIGICVITILTVPFKHPLSAFQNIAHYLQGISDTSQIMTLSNPYLPIGAMLVISLIDILYAIGFIYFFIRPEVKNQFTSIK